MSKEKQDGLNPETLKSAGFVVFASGPAGPEFLLLRASTHGTWGFPKGLSEPGESEIETAAREAREETGLLCSPAAGFREEVSYEVDSPQGMVPKTSVYFLCETRSRGVALSREHDYARWLPAADAMELIPFENLRNVLGRAAARIWIDGKAPFAAVEGPGGRRSLSERDAGKLLFSLGSKRDRWIAHSMQVARSAESIGERISGERGRFLSSFLFPAGCLHDAGRVFDHENHALLGFDFFMRLGLDAHARISLVHWLKGRTRAELVEDGFDGEAALAGLERRGAFEPLLIEEKIVCLADGIVRGDEEVGIGERYRGARGRYGDSPWMRRNEAITRAFAKELNIEFPLAPGGSA